MDLPEPKSESSPLASEIASTTPADALVGTIFDGQFEILELLGTGGMSVVYRAKQKNLNRIVALKLLHRHLISDRSAMQRVQRFKLEASAISQLDHPNVLKVWSFNISSDGVPYIIMECLDGESLTSLIEKRGRLSVEEFVPLLIEICSGLKAAHDRGIIHRDLKPSNVMVVEVDGKRSIKLIDFGLVKFDADIPDAQRLTRSGEILGTFDYMSPEQLLGQRLDARSDIYSLGVLMYQAMTGSLPNEKQESSLLMLQQRMDRLPEAPSLRCPTANINKRMDDLVLRCLEPSASMRLADAGRIEQYLKSDQVTLPPRTTHAARPKFGKFPKKLRTVIIACLIFCLASFALKPVVSREMEKLHERKWRNVVNKILLARGDLKKLGEQTNETKEIVPTKALSEVNAAYRDALWVDEVRIGMGVAQKDQLALILIPEDLNKSGNGGIGSIGKEYLSFANALCTQRLAAEAEKYYLKAKDCLTGLSEYNSDMIEVLQQLWRTATLQNDTQKALGYGDMYLNFLTKLKTAPDTLSLTRRMQSAAYFRVGRFDDAVAMLRKTTDPYERSPKLESENARQPGASEMASTYIQIGQYLLAGGHLSEAFEAASKGFRTLNGNVRGSQDETTQIDALRIMGLVSNARKKYKQAIDYQRLAIGMMVKDPNRKAQIQALELAIARELMSMGCPADALLKAKDVMSECQRPVLRAYYYEAQDTYAKSLVALKRYSEAIETEKEFLKARQQLDPAFVFSSLITLGDAYSKVEESKKFSPQAASSYQDAISTADKAKLLPIFEGKASMRLAAYYHQTHTQLQMARDLADRAAQIYGRESTQAARLQRCIAMGLKAGIVQEQGRLDEAAALYDEAISAFEKLPAELPTIACFNAAADNAVRRNDMRKAEQYYRKALAIAEGNPELRDNIVSELRNLLKTYQIGNDTVQAAATEGLLLKAEKEAAKPPAKAPVMPPEVDSGTLGHLKEEQSSPD